MRYSKELIKNYIPRYWKKFQEFVRKQFWPKYILQDKKFFDWQYLNNPYYFYKSSAMKLMVYNHNLLGYLGFIPGKLKILNREFEKCACLSNLMVNQSCRAMGLGSYLIQSVMRDFLVLWATGYKPKTGPMYKKLGYWKLMGDLRRYIKILNKERVEFLINKKIPKSRIKENLVNYNKLSFKIKEYRRFDKKMDKFWQEVSFKYPITLARTKEYLNWRYADHPFFDYQILVAQKKQRIIGYLVFRVAKTTGTKRTFRIGHILDLITFDEALMPLLWGAEKKMRIKRVDLIDYFSTGLFHHKDLINLGYQPDNKFPYNKIPIYFNPISKKRTKVNFLIYYGGLKKYKNKIGDINNWYVTKGDGDKDRPNPH